MKKQLLFYIMMLLPIVLCAEIVEIDGIYYKVIPKDDVVEVTGNPNKYVGDVVIPESITFNGKDYLVNTIGEHAFYGCTSLTSVTIPNSVTSIGLYAFSSCYSLTSVTIPNSVTTIGADAFSSCYSLTSVTIPNSVTTIGAAAFRACSLTSVTFHCEKIGSWFSNSESIKDVIIGEEVTSIGSSAFSGCSGLTSITIGDNVTSIGSSAFSGCSGLTSITIGDNVKSIGSDAFCECSSLTSITLPNSVESLGYNAFRDCSNLESLVIGNGVTSIADLTFRGCTSLKSVTIPDGVKSIGNAAFFGCNRLTYVSIPGSVKSIGTNAFFDSWEIKTIVSFIERPFKIDCDSSDGTCTFEYRVCRNATLYVPQGELEYYKNIDGWKEFKHIEEYHPDGLDILHPEEFEILYNDGSLIVQGVEDGTLVRVYNINGTQIGYAISQVGQATIQSKLESNSIAIVKIGEKSVKVIVK